MSQTQDIRIQQKVDTKANWETNNPILLDKEIGYERETGKYKIGQTDTHWNDLPYATSVGEKTAEGGEIFNLGRFAHELAHAEGHLTDALGGTSHAEGDYTTSQGYATHAEGRGTYAGMLGYKYDSIQFSKTDPIITLTNIEPIKYAVGDVISVVNGSKYYNCATIRFISEHSITVDSLPFQTIEGGSDPDDNTIFVITRPFTGEIKLGETAHAEGDSTQALEWASHAEGRNTLAYGQYSHAEGRETQAGYNGHAEGYRTHAEGFHSHTEGHGTRANADYAHAEGKSTKAMGESSHAEGNANDAIGEYSHAEGNGVIAEAKTSHAEGGMTRAKGWCSHAEGYAAATGGFASHAEGEYTGAGGYASHAEGIEAHSTGRASHAEGYLTKANGDYSHAEGWKTIADGAGSHTEGIFSETYRNSGHAEGEGSIATGICQHVQGSYNIIDETPNDGNGKGTYAHIVGNGSSDTERSNAHTLDWDGNAWFAGNVETQGVVLTSPNGTKWKITVTNDGKLETTVLI